MTDAELDREVMVVVDGVRKQIGARGPVEPGFGTRSARKEMPLDAMALDLTSKQPENDLPREPRELDKIGDDVERVVTNRDRKRALDPFLLVQSEQRPGAGPPQEGAEGDNDPAEGRLHDAPWGSQRNAHRYVTEA